MARGQHAANMTELSIDHSKLPGVKEVCRDFAVLEDHSLAHTLQEQEIEHHLATNIQRNQLVKTDLKVAKKLQEEEDLRAHTQVKNHQNELELLDSELAQEIQGKLVIEAERQRRQEEKDEDIARLLQEREEKRRKKYYPSAEDEPFYRDKEGHLKGRHKEFLSEYDRPHRHEMHEKKGFERNDPRFEKTASNNFRQRGHSAESRSLNKEEDSCDIHKRGGDYNRSPCKKEKPQRPPLPRTSRHQEDFLNERTNEGHPSENMPRKGRSNSYDLLAANDSDNKKQQDNFGEKSHRSYKDSDCDNERHRRRTPSPCQQRHFRDSGTRSKGIRDAPASRHTSVVRNQEENDAEIARKLQEREFKVNVADVRAAQLAQDEEIARYLTEKEEKANKKSKGREKISVEREMHMHDHVKERTREEHDYHHSRSDKPYRPLPPPPEDRDYDHYYTNVHPHSSPRSTRSKSQSSPKGSYYRP
ncbi:hypothetical protein GDO86_010011 [Hymenochirus boettgeri]|uniref:Coiled-coil domain-containing protein n=1 Tax=Hymenochirus boettgeri TaxID=247094 RepID=A0A8T2JLC4_9PIPI|nr:hypothetical protein GDO86_010011 [Hymenochirus boettgeri]